MSSARIITHPAVERCTRCAELEERIRDLEEDLGLTASQESILQIYTAYKSYRMTPQASKLLAKLYRAKSVVSHAVLEDTIRHDHAKEYVDDGIIKTLVHKIRAILGEDAILTLHGQGYALSPTGRLQVAIRIGDNQTLARLSAMLAGDIP